MAQGPEHAWAGLEAALDPKPLEPPFPLVLRDGINRGDVHLGQPIQAQVVLGRPLLPMGAAAAHSWLWWLAWLFEHILPCAHTRSLDPEGPDKPPHRWGPSCRNHFTTGAAQVMGLCSTTGPPKQLPPEPGFWPAHPLLLRPQRESLLLGHRCCAVALVPQESLWLMGQWRPGRSSKQATPAHASHLSRWSEGCSQVLLHQLQS